MCGSILRDKSEWYIFQEEKGESGTIHLQGTLKLKSKGRPLECLSSLLGYHWEKTKSIKNAIEYCCKETTRCGEVYTNLKIPEPIRVLDEKSLYDWQNRVIEIATSQPDDRTIHWLWEPSGCSGKTALAKYLVIKHDALVVGGRSNDAKHGVIEYQKKNGIFPKIIIINIPRCVEHISYEAIESIKDGLFFSAKYESSMVVMNSPHVFIFSNEYPEVHKLSKDRWNITKIE